jgi:hypothetical protein
MHVVGLPPVQCDVDYDATFSTQLRFEGRSAFLGS